MADFAKSLREIVRLFAIILDNQQAHLIVCLT